MTAEHVQNVSIEMQMTSDMGMTYSHDLQGLANNLRGIANDLQGFANDLQTYK